jgi:hypothetical protein
MKSETKEVYQTLYAKYQSHMLSLPQAAAELGLAIQTAYNMNSQNNFPLPVIRIAKGKPAVRVLDLAAFLSGCQAKKRGRPTKASQVANSQFSGADD